MLSEIPHVWRKAVNRWARLNRRRRREVEGQPAPSRNDEYLFYESLVGVWPLTPPRGQDLQELAGRMTAYMEKATHEAKVHTSWMNPDLEYDAAVREFVAAALNDHPKNRFLSDFQRLHNQIVNWGLDGALSQTLLKLTSPGVPDIYQGQELWDFSLVDPDNRRPVCYELRRKLLEQLRQEVGCNERSLQTLSRQLAQDPRDPRLKLFIIWRVLQLRRQHPDLFQGGRLSATGRRRPAGKAYMRFRSGLPVTFKVRTESCHSDCSMPNRGIDAVGVGLPAAATPGLRRLGGHASPRGRRDILRVDELVYWSGDLARGFWYSGGQRSSGFSDRRADDCRVGASLRRTE